MKELDPRKEVRKLVARERAAQDQYSRFLVKLENLGVYYRRPPEWSPGSIPFVQLEHAEVFQSYSAAEQVAAEIANTHGISRDLLIVVHDPRLDIEEEN